MQLNSPSLYIEINRSNFIFVVGKRDKKNNFKNIYRLEASIKGVNENSISNYDEILNLIKQNLYSIEQKLDNTFTEVVLILENLNTSFVNVAGFKKLNSSQILRENITYILNTLKSCVNEHEAKKTILHIFNTKYFLDEKKIENLPIGLFGDFYSHELSFSLIDTNDFKNIENIFNVCNLKIKKVFLKSFIKGCLISDKNIGINSFFLLQINENDSKIIFFENQSLKFEQSFQFGKDIILNDISKILSLNRDTIKKILNNVNFNEKISDDEVIESKFFDRENFRKIKKKLIFEIASARIKEIFELILLKNINLKSFAKDIKTVLLEFNVDEETTRLNDIIKEVVLENTDFDFISSKNFPEHSVFEKAGELVHFGWKTEAIPIAQTKKTLIAKFFEAIFD